MMMSVERILCAFLLLQLCTFALLTSVVEQTPNVVSLFDGNDNCTQCIGHECCGDFNVCCIETCCSSNSTCCGGLCCLDGETCCGDFCCAANSTCCDNDECCIGD